jgi:glycosyltransferase involved in cell wall biosynthesis
MSMGKAIVAPGTGGIVEMLEDGKTGLFAHVKQPNHLAAAMLKLIDDGETRRSIGRNAQQEVSQVDSRRAFAEAIQLTIENCLAREGTRVAVSPAPPCTKGATL